MKTRVGTLTLLLLAFALFAFAKTYRTTYPAPCSDLWPAVKNVLNNPDNHYDVKASDDAQMHADYDVKHEAHVTVTGVFTQRQNHVTLVARGNTCEMQVVSNFSGWEHSDRGDFKKRVDDALATLKSASPAKPEEPAPVK